MCENVITIYITANDYVSIQDRVVTFLPTVTKQSVNVTIIDDLLLEGKEDFFGVLTLPDGELRVILGRSRAPAVIQDNDGIIPGKGKNTHISLLY